MRRLVLVALLGACGRIAFDPASLTGGDGGANGDSAGPVGPRYLATMTPMTDYTYVSGTGGEAVVSFNFTGAADVAGVHVTGAASQTSSAIVRLAQDGAVRWSAVVDATISCDVRDVSMRGDVAIATAISNGTAAPALGPCAVDVAGYQDPVYLAIDGAGGVSLLARWPGGSSNAQGWRTVVLSDGSLATTGIYASDLTVGQALAAAQNDPNAFAARFTDQATVAWARGVTSTAHVMAGPIDADGTDACTLFSYDGASTLFGTPVTGAGGYDDAVVRLGPDGTARFVRTIGSTANDSTYGGGGIVAVAGGCTAAVDVAGDVTLDGISLPAADGGGVVATFDTSGAVTAAYRLPAAPFLARAGTHVIAAFATTVPLTIGGQMIMPQGRDVVVAELGAQGPTRVIGIVGGAGEQAPVDLAAIAPDAVAITLTATGDTTFGGAPVATGTNGVSAIAVLGI